MDRDNLLNDWFWYRIKDSESSSNRLRRYMDRRPCYRSLRVVV